MSRATDAKEAKDLESNKNNLDEEAIGKLILDCAFKVHTKLGPGLLESVYESALAWELTRARLKVERQKPIPVIYDGAELDVAFRADLIVEGKVLVELKAVETIVPLFKKVTTNYIRLIPLKLGFLINFNEVHLKDRITRVTNGLEGKPFFSSPSQPSRSSRDIIE